MSIPELREFELDIEDAVEIKKGNRNRASGNDEVKEEKSSNLDEDDDENSDDDEDDFIKPEQCKDARQSYIFGLAIGRFDIRIAHDSALSPDLPDPFDRLPVCPPAMLVGTDGLPANADNIASEAWLRARPNAITLPPEPARSKKITAADYPLDIPWDGILIDDSDDPRDILVRLRAALRYLHGEKASEKERVRCSSLSLTFVWPISG
jgi:hypothetical protein